MGLVQRIDDVLLRHNNVSRSLVYSQSCNSEMQLTTILWNNVNDSLKLFSCITRRTKLWCGLNTLQTPFSTWMRLEVESPLVWNLWILLPMGQQNIWRLASGAAAAWSILEGCCLFHAWEAMVVIWTMIDDMRSWFGRAEFDPLWVLRRFWFVEEEDRLRLSQMKCYSGSVCSCKVYGSCREIYGRPPRNAWELDFGVEAEQHASSFDDALERDGQFGPRCRLMCLVYIRCLFFEASRTCSIGCFVCDLHRFR